MTIGEIIPIQEYDYMIFPHDSRFKVKSGDDGTTVFETANQTDAFTAFEYCRDQMLAKKQKTVIKPFTTGSLLYPMGQKLILNSATHNGQSWEGCAGPCSTAVRLQATSNAPVFEITGTSGACDISIENLFLTHNQSGYTSSLIRLVDTVIEVILRGLRFSDFSLNKGNAIGFELLTNARAQYEILIDSVISRGLENIFYFNLAVPDTGVTFISSILFDKIFAWNCKRVALATGVSGGKLLALDFDKVHYQYSTSNVLAAGEAPYDFSTVLNTYLTRLSQCQIWDIPANTNMINMGATTEIFGVGVNLSHRVGGTGAAKYKAFDYYNHNKGYYETNAVVGQRDYNISHGLGIAPTEVYVTVMNQDINNQVAAIVPKSSIDTTKFTVRLLNAPYPGTNNLKFSWRAFL